MGPVWRRWWNCLLLHARHLGHVWSWFQCLVESPWQFGAQSFPGFCPSFCWSSAGEIGGLFDLSSPCPWFIPTSFGFGKTVEAPGFLRRRCCGPFCFRVLAEGVSGRRQEPSYTRLLRILQWVLSSRNLWAHARRFPSLRPVVRATANLSQTEPACSIVWAAPRWSCAAACFNSTLWPLPDPTWPVGAPTRERRACWISALSPLDFLEFPYTTAAPHCSSAIHAQFCRLAPRFTKSSRWNPFRDASCRKIVAAALGGRFTRRLISSYECLLRALQVPAQDDLPEVWLCAATFMLLLDPVPHDSMNVQFVLQTSWNPRRQLQLAPKVTYTSKAKNLFLCFCFSLPCSSVLCC